MDKSGLSAFGELGNRKPTVRGSQGDLFKGHLRGDVEDEEEANHAGQCKSLPSKQRGQHVIL